MKIIALLLCLLVPAIVHASPPHGGATVTASGDPTVGVIPSYDDTYANWSVAGLTGIGGIPTRSTQCGATVTPSGITPPAGGDDASKINAAIAACTAGQVVLLGTGTFQLAQSELPLLVNKGITIRGSGSPSNACTAATNSTTSTPCWSTIVRVRDGAISDWLVSTTTAGSLCGVTPASTTTCSAGGAVFLLSPSGNFNWGWAGCNFGTTPTGCGTTLTADAAAGATTISVTSTANFSVGMFVLIDENPALVSTTNPTTGAAIQASPEWSSSSGSPQVERFANADTPSAGYSFNANRLGQEIHKISAIGSGTLTFDSPLSIGFRQSGGHGAQVYWPTIQSSSTTPNPFLQQAGIENLTIDRPPNGGVEFTFCAYCWVKNVEVSNWIAGGVGMIYSDRVQVEGMFIHDCTDCENNGAEYPIAVDTATTEPLLWNNITLRGGKGMVGRGANTAVVAYNYQDDTMYMQAVIGDYWEDMGVNGSHYAGTHHFLFEGNWGDNCDGDETHGSAAYHTFFRNWCTGTRTTFTDPSNGRSVNDASDIGWGSGGGASPPATVPAPRRAAGPMAFNYWYAFAGNVLGMSGITDAAHGWSYQGAFGASSGCTSKCIWLSGWVGSEWPAPDSNLTAAVSPNWIFRSQNWDYFRSALDSTSGYTAPLPNSFFTSSAPSFFGTGTTGCTYTWPWVNSQGTTKTANAAGTGCTSFSGLPAKARWDAGTPFIQP